MELQVIESRNKSTLYVLLDRNMRLIKAPNDYLLYLRVCGKAENTLLAYARDLKVFFSFLERNDLDFQMVDSRMVQGYVAFFRSPYEDGIFLHVDSVRTPATINRMIASLYGFYCYHAMIHGTDNPLIKFLGSGGSAFKGMFAHTKQSSYVKHSLFKVKQSTYRVHLIDEGEASRLEEELPTPRDKLAGTLDGIKKRLETFTGASNVDEDDLVSLRTAVELLTGFEKFDIRKLYKR